MASIRNPRGFAWTFNGRVRFFTFKVLPFGFSVPLFFKDVRVKNFHNTDFFYSLATVR